MAIELKQKQQAGQKKSDVSSFFDAQLSLGGERVSARDRLFFTERLALLLETGTNLHHSLQEMREQTDKKKLQRIIEDLAEQVVEGKAFSAALARHPEVFSSMYVSLVEASEQGGFMFRVLNQLRDMEERREKLRSTLRGAMVYPVFLMFFSLAVTVFILTSVFPKFGTLFESIRDQLPFTTILLMSAGEILRSYWWLIAAACAGLYFGAKKWFASPDGKAILHRLQLSVPYLGDIFVKFYLVQVLRTMSLSLENGVSVPRAISSCREIVDNVHFRTFMERVAAQVADGHGLARGFEECSFMPIMVKQMMRTGETSGSLSLVMAKVAGYFEEDLSRNISIVSKIVEPVMLLLMGMIVGTIVASLILPIFRLSRAVH